MIDIWFADDIIFLCCWRSGRVHKKYGQKLKTFAIKGGASLLILHLFNIVQMGGCFLP